MTRGTIRTRLTRLERAAHPDQWTFTIDTGRKINVPIEAVLQVFMEGLHHIHDPTLMDTDPDHHPAPPSPTLLLMARVVATTEKSMLGRSVVAAAKAARDLHNQKDTPRAK